MVERNAVGGSEDRLRPSSGLSFYITPFDGPFTLDGHNFCFGLIRLQLCHGLLDFDPLLSCEL